VHIRRNEEDSEPSESSPRRIRPSAPWATISRNRTAVVMAEKSCTARATPSWWPVWRWNLAYKNPFFLAAMTAHACTRIQSMAKPLTQEGLERKEKDIMRSVCAHWDIEPSSLDKVGKKLQQEILETVQMQLEAFKHKLTGTLIDNSIEARHQIRACSWGHVWVAPGTDTSDIPPLDLSFLPSWALHQEKQQRHGLTVRDMVLRIQVRLPAPAKVLFVIPKPRVVVLIVL
jgi:hypothetical protein